MSQITSSAAAELTERADRTPLICRYATPNLAGGIVALAKLLSEHLCSRGRSLYVVNDWSVWPSSEHMDLFRRVRQTHTCDEPLMTVRGEWLDQGESEYAACVLTCGMSFAWSFIFCAEGFSVGFKFDDDEYFDLIGDSPNEVKEFAALLGSFGVERLQEEGE